MNVLKGMIIALAMYSKIPVPQFPWKDENMHYAICFFPLVGVVSGGLLMLWLYLAKRLEVSAPAAAVIASLIPVIVTGGIHIDGYMDTSDALSSWRTREKRLEILKDSHIGAFAVICLMILSGLYLASALEIISRLPGPVTTGTVPVWALTFVYARTLSGCSVVFFKNAKKESTLYAFVSAAHQRRVQRIMIAEAAVCAAGLIAADPLAGTVIAAGGLLTFVYYRRRAYRDFGGTTGDLCGWFLCLAETVMVILMALLSLTGH